MVPVKPPWVSVPGQFPACGLSCGVQQAGMQKRADPEPGELPDAKAKSLNLALRDRVQ